MRPLLNKIRAFPQFPPVPANTIYLPFHYDAGAGTIRDRSGLNNHGTVVGATWAQTTTGLKVLSFDGTDDAVRVLYGAGTINLTVAPITCFALFNPDSGQVGNVSLFQRYIFVAANNAGGILFDFDSTNDRIRGYVRRDDVEEDEFFSANSSITVGKWNTGGWIWDGSNLQAYANGAASGAAVAHTNTLKSLTTNLVIGRNTDETASSYKGKIGMVALSNTNLGAGWFKMAHDALRGVVGNMA